jgi:hypothetical protein
MPTTETTRSTASKTARFLLDLANAFPESKEVAYASAAVQAFVESGRSPYKVLKELEDDGTSTLETSA